LLSVKGIYTPKEIDLEIDLINRLARQGEFAIKIPNVSKHARFTSDARIIQLYLHWAKFSKRRQVFTNLDGSNLRNVEEFVRTPWGLATSLVAKRIRAKNGIKDITISVRNFRNTALRKSNQRQLFSDLKGPVFAFYCADHLNFCSERLYSGDFPLTVESYQTLAKSIMQAFGSSGPARLRLGIDAIGTMLHELIKNTDEHGRYDYRVDDDESGHEHTKFIMPISVRGLVARKVYFKDSDFDKDAEGEDLLRRFFLNLKGKKESKNSAVYFSVFDMGSGYASSALQRPTTEISFEDEFEATVQCFEKSFSVKKDMGLEKVCGEGLGLSLESLRSLGGIMHLRTGRVSLYIDPEYYRESDKNSIRRCIKLRSGKKHTPYSRVSGTAVTMIVPA